MIHKKSMVGMKIKGVHQRLVKLIIYLNDSMATRCVYVYAFVGIGQYPWCFGVVGYGATYFVRRVTKPNLILQTKV